MSDEKRAVIFVNGIIDRYDWIKPYLKQDDYLIAVDGGYRHMQACGLKPHLLIGDLDSVSGQDVNELILAGVEIQKYPAEKKETDLEIAFLTALQRGHGTLRVIGAFGGRMDHWLANLFILTNPAFGGMDICYEGGDERAFLIRTEARVEGRPGDLLSLIPMGGEVQGVRTQGLKYALRDETLYAYESRGVSNEFLDERAWISVKKGMLLCIHSHRKTGDDAAV